MEFDGFDVIETDFLEFDGFDVIEMDGFDGIYMVISTAVCT